MTVKKKKKGKGLLFAVLILIVLLVLYFVIDLQQKKADQEAETEETEESSLPVSVTEDEIAKVTVKNGDVTMTYTKSDDTWTYEEDHDFPLDESAVDTKMSKLTSLTVDRVLESPEDLSEYGLDEPKQEVTVLKTDGTAFTLYIGNQNSSNNDFYVKVDDGADVYTMPASSVNVFDMQPYDVAKADTFPTLESTNIRNIKVEKEDGTVEFASDETATSWTVKDQDGNEEKAGTTAASDLTSAVSSLSYKDFVDYKGDDLTRYGLDKPTETVTIVTEETEAETEEETETEEESEVASESESVSETETAESETGSEELATEAVSEEETTEAISETAVETVSETSSEDPTTEAVSETETSTEAVTEAETEAESETEIETETEEPKTIEVTTTLLIGNTNDDGDYYVKLADNNGVYTMSESTLEKLLNVDVLDYVSLYLNDVPMTSMKSLEVTCQGETKTLTVESEEVPVETEASTEEETEAETIKISAGALDEAETEAETETETETETEQQMQTVYHYLVDGEEVEATPFRLFYNNLIALQAQKRTSEAPEVSGDPDFKLVFTKVDGTSLTTEFYLADDGLYDVLSDQALPARISKMDVQKIIGYYEDVINPEPETETEIETETVSEE